MSKRNPSVRSHVALGFLIFLVSAVSVLSDSLERGFFDPPESTKPWCYWYWISDNISREGITRDLEAMRKVGIGEAFIGNIYLDNVKAGAVKALSPEWWGMVEHAIREGGRIGVRVGMFNCPGWSQSGGPWVKPEQAMRRLDVVEYHLTGPMAFFEPVPAGRTFFQDVALLAFPDRTAYANAGIPQLTSSVPIDNATNMIDGDTGSSAALMAGNKEPVELDFDFPSEITARSLLLVPWQHPFAVDCELLAEKNGHLRSIRKFSFDRSNSSIAVGFVPQAPLTISFPPVSAKKFRVVFSKPRQNPGLAEVRISGEPMIERYIEKQLGNMHPTPLPMWGNYLWPRTAEPGAPGLAVDPREIVDLSKTFTNGTWQIPPGKWIVQRIGMVLTGTKNSPASPEGQGFEIDKMNRQIAQDHFDAYIGKVLQRIPAKERKAFQRVIADSYEMGAQNWTDGLQAIFIKRYGYDPQPWLPTLTGRIIVSADQSERFLWDLRRIVADQVAYDYVGGLRDACHKQGLKLWLENYGHWGFPAEFLQYGGQSDEVSGEFWASGDLGSIELRAASSAAHTYGKPIVSAEAFTSGARFEATPWSLKKRGDWALTEGINHWVLHVNIHQPWEDKLPGVNAWFSTEFNRHNPWFFAGREWIDYYRRCHFLLQQGKHAAEVAYFIGEDTPKMTGLQKPALPAGYNYDYINAEVIRSRLGVKDGRFVLPDGMTYRVLVLPELETMMPELLETITSLVRAGGVVLGSPPSRSPSLHSYPQADKRVQALAAALWENCDGERQKWARYGKGRVFRNCDLQFVFREIGVSPQISELPPEVLWTQRRAGDTRIYFLCNQSDQTVTLSPEFDVGGKAPEVWDAAARTITRPASIEVAASRTRLKLELEPRGSVFVVFRKKASLALPVQTAWEAVEGREITSAWSLEFPPGRDVPTHIELATLIPVSEHSDPAIRHFSGEVKYTTSFEQPPIGKQTQVVLDLHAVEGIAEVTLNGQAAGILWKPPWRLDVTRLLRPGKNKLSVAVTGTWRNRLIGEARYPNGFPDASGSIRPFEFKTFLTAEMKLSGKEPLTPFGLIGPVELRAADRK